jgi:hypothetical protein
MNLVNNKLRIMPDDLLSLTECGAAVSYIEIDEDARGNCVVNIVGDVNAIQRYKAFSKTGPWKSTAYNSKLTRTFKRQGTPINMFN